MITISFLLSIKYFSLTRRGYQTPSTGIGEARGANGHMVQYMQYKIVSESSRTPHFCAPQNESHRRAQLLQCRLCGGRFHSTPVSGTCPDPTGSSACLAMPFLQTAVPYFYRVKSSGHASEFPG